MDIDRRLVNKGRRTPIGPLLEQAMSHVALGRKYHRELGRFGWPERQTDILDNRVFGLDALLSGRSSACDAALRAGHVEALNKLEAEVFIRRLRLAVPLAIRDCTDKAIFEAAFDEDEDFDDAPNKIADYLQMIAPFVETLDEQLTPYMGRGEPPSKILASIRASLAHEEDENVAALAFPDETVNIYIVAGELLEMVEDMNRVAQIAFDGRAEIAAKFNTDIILKSRTKRNSKRPRLSSSSDSLVQR